MVVFVMAVPSERGSNVPVERMLLLVALSNRIFFMKAKGIVLILSATLMFSGVVAAPSFLYTRTKICQENDCPRIFAHRYRPEASVVYKTILGYPVGQRRVFQNIDRFVVSPDRKEFLYEASLRGSHNANYLVRSNKIGTKVEVHEVFRLGEIKYSPSGRYAVVVYSSISNRNGSALIIDRISESKWDYFVGYAVHGFIIDPSETFIAFREQTATGSFGVVIMSLDGTKFINGDYFQDITQGPVFSNDGKFVTYTVIDQGNPLKITVDISYLLQQKQLFDEKQ